MKKLITLFITFALVLTAAVPTFAAAVCEPKENENNPEISISYEETSSGYNMKLESDLPGVLYINNTPYKTNQINKVSSPVVSFNKNDDSSRFTSGTKVYRLHNISTITPAPAETPNGTEYVGSYSADCELIYTREATKNDVGANFSTFTQTVKNAEQNITKKTTTKYYIDEKETTQAAYNKYRSEHSCKESIKTSYVKSDEPVLTGSEETSREEVYSVDSNCNGKLNRTIHVVDYYDVTQYYETVNKLETVSNPVDTGDYSGKLKINAQNNLSKEVTVTGNIELSDNTINFSSDRFNIKNGKGTFKTTSLSAISLTKLRKGQTYKISNVKADGVEVASVSPATGTVGDSTEVKITLKGSSSQPTTTTYTITWKNWDGTTLKIQKVSKGVVPSFGGTPTRAADSNYTYTFSGWSPSVTAANGNATYTAQYNSTEKPTASTTKYTITWKNYDGKILKTQIVPKGTIPSYEASPVRAADSNYTYEFKGWSPSVVAANGNAVYTAQYTSIAKVQYYTITWKNWNGSVLKTQKVAKGLKPSYSGTPTRAADSKYTYTFKGWSPSVTTANGNATYTATYTAKAKAIPLNVKVKIKKPKAAKAAFTAKWTKLSKANRKKASGIQIQYSTSKNFSNAKIVTAGKKASSKKISRLKRKTNYYVRIRAVKGSAVGPWSGVKKIKTK